MAEYYYSRNHSTISLIILALGILFLLLGISTGFEVVCLWRSLKKREETRNPVKKVRFSSLLNVYEENDQSFEEDSNDSNNLVDNRYGWSPRGTSNDEQRNLNVIEVESATSGLSSQTASLPSFDYWMSLIKEQQRKNSRQNQNKSFRERNCTFYENIDSSVDIETSQNLSSKDKELFQNDSNDEMLI